MAKRFIDTKIFNDVWFMNLPNKYKLFWIYIITNCDHAGIWQVNYKEAQFYVGEHLEPIECERHLTDRIIKINDGQYWFIPKFITFQYGNELSENNKAIKNVIVKLKQYNLLNLLENSKINEAPTKELQRGYEAPKEKDKEQVKEEVKEEVKVKEKDTPKFENFVSYNDYLNSIEDKNSDPYKLLIHIQKNYPEVAKMKYQMNLQNAIDLLKKYSKKEIDLILNNMDNWSPLLKNNKYVNKTIISWINK